jgi:hypothetical protein
MTASRFDTRKEALLDEVNAIEITFLRTGLIPEPHRSEVRALLKRYVDIRVDLARNPAKAEQAVRESEAIQGQLWPHATALADLDLKNAVIVALFIQSLNEMFDLQTNASRSGFITVPTVIWLALLGITILAMVQVGYWVGRSTKANWLSVVTLSLAFSSVVVLIADLDRSGAGAIGAIRLNQQPVMDLQNARAGNELVGLMSKLAHAPGSTTDAPRRRPAVPKRLPGGLRAPKPALPLCPTRPNL